MMGSASTRDRNRAWAVSWLSYATYYTGRKGFSVAKKAISAELGIGESLLGAIDTVYLTAYAFGQFANGLLGDRIGARRLVGYGMLLSAACCAGFGAVSAPVLFLGLFGLNGWAQASGWPGTTRAMAEWTTAQNRGTVMAFWATCYQVGGIAASFIAGWLLAHFGWRSAFFGPAALIAVVALLVLAFMQPPPHTGPDSIPPPSSGPGASSGDGDRGHAGSAGSRPFTNRELRRRARRAVLRNKLLWFYATSYFFIKFIRYAILFWMPYYLAKRLGYAEDDAAYASTAFEVGGIVGVIVIGVSSDRLRGVSRSLLAATWLVALGLLLLAYGRLAGMSVLMNVSILALVGAALFGPDSLISGAAAQDAGGPHAAATATGFVNGMGSLGGILEGLLVPVVTQRFGWGALFPVLVALAFLAALALVPSARSDKRVRLA